MSDAETGARDFRRGDRVRVVLNLEATFAFTASLVESLSEQGFTESQTRTAVLAALKTLFGVVWKVDPKSELGEELRQCSRERFRPHSHDFTGRNNYILAVKGLHA